MQFKIKLYRQGQEPEIFTGDRAEVNKKLSARAIQNNDLLAPFRDKEGNLTGIPNNLWYIEVMENAPDKWNFDGSYVQLTQICYFNEYCDDCESRKRRRKY